MVANLAIAIVTFHPASAQCMGGRRFFSISELGQTEPSSALSATTDSAVTAVISGAGTRVKSDPLSAAVIRRVLSHDGSSPAADIQPDAQWHTTCFRPVCISARAGTA